MCEAAKKIYFIRMALISAVFTILFLKAEAQISDTLSNIYEEGWIEKMNGIIAADISFNNSYETFRVETSSNKTILYPNTPNNLRLKLHYEFISLGIQFAPDFLPGNGDNDSKGETTAFQLNAALVFKNWFSNITYSKVQGYYLKNTDDYINWTKGDAYIQFPDLNYEGVSISSGYIHNSKFSLRSLTTQTERQLKSAGSFMPVFNFEYYRINDKSNSVNTQKSKNIEFHIGPGYAHTFVLKEKIYASIGMLASIGYLNTKLTTRTEGGNLVTNQNNLLLRADCKIGMGYNSSKFYTGIFTTLSDTWFKQENTTARNTETNVFYHIFFGMRFNAPNLFKKKGKG